MDTKPLERFATQARRELIASVAARATAVLAIGSVARSEHGETVKRLEAEIAQYGQKHVIDKVAYTWFNRLIALRYMDALGYTSAGVVSPAQGHAHGQPEILADAKRSHLDSEVITSDHTRVAVMGLLDGTRRSTDAEGEAYALLLTEYCRFWNKAMPFMFEREGDYTELLVPTGLLADGAILSRAREVLTENVCEDVEVIGWLYQFYISERKQEVFDGFSAKGKARKLAGPDEIPAATQLFTPHWIVRYLVENSLGRLWMLNRPASRLVDQMDYYIPPVDEETDFLKISGPDELTLIDPACGSGHMLTYAFDLLYAIYAEEGYAPSEIPSLIFAHNLHGTEIDPRAGALAAFALTMKARAKDRRFFQREAEPQICVIEPLSFTPDELDFLVTKSGDRHAEETFWNQFQHADTLGSLVQPDTEGTTQAASVLHTLDDELFYVQTLERARQAVRQAEALSRKYTVVTANPPYMGSKNMDVPLTEFAKSHFPSSKSDLFAMFIQRCLEFTTQHGMTAMITMQSWMFITSYEELRRAIVHTSPPVSMVHLGERAFDSIGGSVVSTTAFVLEPGRRTTNDAAFVRAVDGQNESAKEAALLEASRNPANEWRFTASAEDFVKVPGYPIAYWLSDAMRNSFTRYPALSNRSRSAIGMVTGKNALYVRQWWEVADDRICLNATSRDEATRSGRKWFPYAKGGEFRRWAGNLEMVVDWENDGKRLQTTLVPGGSRVWGHNFNLDRIFRPGIAWTVVTSGTQSFRIVPAGSLFDAAAGMCQSPTDDVHLGVLNSSVASELLATINPTLNMHPGYLGVVPVPPAADSDECSANVAALVKASEDDWADLETSWDFRSPSWLPDATSNASLPRRYSEWSDEQALTARRQQARETENNRFVGEAYCLQDQVAIEVPLHRVSLTRNVEFRYGPDRTSGEYQALERADLVAELISYAVGCMFGRYSLDISGLILADQGSILQDYLAKAPSPMFWPDGDNVIPFVDDGWFEDDIVERFREFLRVAFGAKNFEANLRFVEESLGVKTIRDYFIAKSNPSGKTIAKSKFYDDHLQRYKKRPIYWMFSSPKGSFNALIYLHRYTPATVSTVLNEYLREYRAKLEVALQRAEEVAGSGASAKDQKETDRLRAVLAELRDYEHDVLYPLDIQKVEIDLDDGVKVNYPKFVPAIRPIKGLEASE